MDDNPASDEEPHDDQLFQEASLWFARMRGPDAASFQQDFDAWLARGAAHRGAYNRAGEIFSLGKFMAEEHADTATSVVSGKPPTRRPLSVGLALAGVVALILFGIWVSGARTVRLGMEERPAIAGATSPSANQPIVLISGGDHEQVFRLEDGSTVTLAPGGRLAVAFDRFRRGITLQQGHGRFEVAHGSRPFIVYAGGGSVTAHGTIFTVEIGAERLVTVKLLQGAIDVALPKAPKTPKPLRSGQELQFQGVETSSQAPYVGSQPALKQIASGAAAFVEYDDVQLSDLLAEANRHGGPSVEFADPGIGALRLSGRFSVGDPAKLAERAAFLLNLQVDRNDPGKIVLRHG